MTYTNPAEIWTSERLLAGYSAMANDERREREADEWCEALIADVSARA